MECPGVSGRTVYDYALVKGRRVGVGGVGARSGEPQGREDVSDKEGSDRRGGSVCQYEGGTVTGRQAGPTGETEDECPLEKLPYPMRTVDMKDERGK